MLQWNKKVANRVAKLFNKKYYSNLLWHWGLFFPQPSFWKQGTKDSEEKRIHTSFKNIFHLGADSKIMLQVKIFMERNKMGKKSSRQGLLLDHNIQCRSDSFEKRGEETGWSRKYSPDGSAILKVLPGIWGPQRECCSLEKFFIHQKWSDCSTRSSGQMEFWYECRSGF